MAAPDTQMTTTSETTIPAALSWRLLAMLYDAIPVAGLWFAVAALGLFLRGGVPVTPNSPAALAEFGVMVLVNFGYLGLSWRRGGQSLGMRAWRVHLVNANAGANIAWSQLAVRFLVAIVSLMAAGLGFAWSLFDRERRTWHDLASGTRLLRTPRPPRVSQGHSA
ncbi:MAG TPA: RDD family protein [Chiayiivirga sp.]|nr:RDD family protein [Chiayiivirga sp.]